MTITYTAVLDPVWSNVGNTAFNCLVQFDGFDEAHPFTASAVGPEPHVIEIWNRGLNGDFGPIADYELPPEAALGPPSRLMANVSVASGEIIIDGVEAFSGGMMLAPTEFLLFLTHSLDGNANKYVPTILPIGEGSLGVNDYELADDYLYLLLGGEETPSRLAIVIQKAE